MRFRMVFIFAVASILFCSFALMLQAVEDDDDDAGRSEVVFTPASINGAYGAIVTGIGGQFPASAIAQIAFDGARNGTGRSIWNLPDGSGGRMLLETIFEGTYEIDPDGTGVFETQGGLLGRTVFVVTKSRVIERVRVALEVSILSEEVLGFVGGNLITLLATRQSEEVSESD